jgi:hypothetical protein
MEVFGERVIGHVVLLGNKDCEKQSQVNKLSEQQIITVSGCMYLIERLVAVDSMFL